MHRRSSAIIALLAAFGAAEAAPRAHRLAARLHVDGAIGPAMVAQVQRKLEAARVAGADLLVVEIDSPGGRVDASFALAELFQDVAWARTVAYVPRQAFSGGAVAALGCTDLVLGPRASFGDIGPIIQGEDGKFRHAEEKVVSALAQQLRTLAQAKGRPGALAEAFADRKLRVYRVFLPGRAEPQLRSERELAALPAGARKEPIPETGGDRFLTLDGARTVELGFGSFTIDSYPELLQRLGGADAELELARTWVDGLADTLNHPVCTVLLIAVGLACLYMEFAFAGMGMMWIPSALCFTLFFWSRILGGTAGWLALALFAMGIACLAVELFVIPGFGVVGLTGILLTLAGLVVGVQGFVAPTSSADWSQTVAALAQVTAAGVLFLAGAGYASRHFDKVPFLRDMILAPQPGAATEGSAATAENLAEFLGQTGVAATDLRPAGKVRIGTKLLDVVAEGFFVPANSPVEVTVVAGNRVVVRKLG